MIRFVWTNRAWALAILPLIIAWACIYAGAWYLATRLAAACHIHEWHKLPDCDGCPVFLGDMQPPTTRPIVQALAPTTAWLLIAAGGTIAHALFGRARRRFVARLLFVVTLILPLTALVMELSCIYDGGGYDGETLHAHRHLMAAVMGPLVGAFMAVGWLRFRAAFLPSLSWRQYVLGWAMLFAVAELLHQTTAAAFHADPTVAGPVIRAPVLPASPTGTCLDCCYHWSEFAEFHNMGNSVVTECP
jgi:hypothetical protein